MKFHSQNISLYSTLSFLIFSFNLLILSQAEIIQHERNQNAFSESRNLSLAFLDCAIKCKSTENCIGITLFKHLEEIYSTYSHPYFCITDLNETSIRESKSKSGGGTVIYKLKFPNKLKKVVRRPVFTLGRNKRQAELPILKELNKTQNDSNFTNISGLSGKSGVEIDPVLDSDSQLDNSEKKSHVKITSLKKSETANDLDPAAASLKAGLTSSLNKMNSTAAKEFLETLIMKTNMNHDQNLTGSPTEKLTDILNQTNVFENVDSEVEELIQELIGAFTETSTQSQLVNGQNQFKESSPENETITDNAETHNTATTMAPISMSKNESTGMGIAHTVPPTEIPSNNLIQTVKPGGSLLKLNNNEIPVNHTTTVSSLSIPNTDRKTASPNDDDDITNELTLTPNNELSVNATHVSEALLIDSTTHITKPSSAEDSDLIKDFGTTTTSPEAFKFFESNVSSILNETLKVQNNTSTMLPEILIHETPKPVMSLDPTSLRTPDSVTLAQVPPTVISEMGIQETTLFSNPPIENPPPDLSTTSNVNASSSIPPVFKNTTSMDISTETTKSMEQLVPVTPNPVEFNTVSIAAIISSSSSRNTLTGVNSLLPRSSTTQIPIADDITSQEPIFSTIQTQIPSSNQSTIFMINKPLEIKSPKSTMSPEAYSTTSLRPLRIDIPTESGIIERPTDNTEVLEIISTDEECVFEDKERFRRNILAGTYAILDGEPILLTFVERSTCVASFSKHGRHGIFNIKNILPGFPLSYQVDAAAYINDTLYLFDSYPGKDQSVYRFTYDNKLNIYEPTNPKVQPRSDFLSQQCGISLAHEVSVKAFAQLSPESNSSCIIFDMTRIPIISPDSNEEIKSLATAINYILETEFVSYVEAVFSWLDGPVTTVYIFGSDGELYALNRNILFGHNWVGGIYTVIPYSLFPV